MISQLARFSFLLSSLALVACSQSEEPNESSPTVKSVATIAATMDAGYTQASTYVGRVEAVLNSQVGFEVSGTLTDIKVDEGDQVRKGDILAVLDTSRLSAQRAEASAILEKADADLDLAQATLTRVQDAYSYKGVSQQELDEAAQSLNALKASQRAAQAQLRRIEVDLDKAQLTAPFDGLVIRRQVDPGQFLLPGTPGFTLQSSGPAEVRIGVSPTVASSIKDQEDHVLTINKVEYEAKLKTIIPRRDERTRTLDAVFVLQDTDSSVRPGDLANLNVDSWIERSGFWIPLASLSEGPRGLWQVLIAENHEGELGTHTLVNRTVEVLHFDEETAFVDGTLQDGDLLVSDGLHRVVVGQRVTVSTKQTQLALQTEE
ncbi:MAG: efflux RND transporter periplasmic adaptor subunit [Pseudomonadota bacterium]